MDRVATGRGARRGSALLLPALAIVALVALSVRLIYLAEIQTSPFFHVPVIDAEAYDAMARRIAAGDLEGGKTAFWQAPLYPYFLAALRSLAMGSIGVRVVQFVLGTLTAVLLAGLAARLLGRRAGLMAGLGAALYGPLLFFESRLLAPSLILFLNVAGLVALDRARASTRLGPRVLAGVLFGLAALARPDAFLVALVLGVGLGVMERRQAPSPAGRRAAGRRAVAFLAAALLVTLAATARNWIVARDLVWVSSNGGINFYLGNNAESDQTIEIRPGLEWAALVERPHLEAGLTRASDRSRFFYREAGRFIRQEPLAWASLMAKKTARFFAGYEIRRNEDAYEFRRESRLLSFLLWRAGSFGFPFGLVSPLALMGAVLLWPRRRDLAHVYLYAGAYALAVIAFFVTARYRLPVVPALLILAAGAVDWVLARRRVPGTVFRFALVGIALALILNLNAATPRIDASGEYWRLFATAEFERGNYAQAIVAQARALEADPERAELHYDQGIYLAAAGDTAGAVAAYRQAIALAPDFGEPKVNLGNLLVRAGDYRTAVRLFIEAAVTDPNLVPAQIAVGNAFLNSGHPDSALARFDRAATLDPESVEAVRGRIAALMGLGRGTEAVDAAREAIVRFGERPDLLAALGRALKGVGRNEEAVAALGASLRAEPGQAETWVALGQCYRNLGQLEDAAEAQKQAIALAPGLVAAHVNLADVQARRGFYDQAIASLQQALALDPYNEAAAYNLAVVHAELGEDRQAIALLEQLLLRNPEHGPAQHALARLRGEEVPHP